LRKRQLCVQRAVWQGHTEAPKGGRLRYVPLTQRLTAALRAARHLRGPLVFCDGDGKPVSENIIGNHVDHSARTAKLKHRGVHVLPHVLFAPGDAWRTG
jgi:integrase